VKYEPLTDGELVRLYETVLFLEQYPKWRQPCFLVRCALATGARVFELRNIQIKHILTDYDPPVIFVPHGKGPRQNGGDGKARHIQVIPEFGPKLRAYVQQLNGNGLPDHFLFHTGNPERPAAKLTLQRAWDYVINRAGIEYRPIHAGARSTHATWEADRLPPHKLGDRLGHTDQRVTEKYYRRQIIGRDYTTEAPRWRAVASR
jgi:integrase